ncbi:MAG: cysteine--tRNA ligase [Nitrosarchaeum sp.]|nr:cysteine--tRNA ligase [Nitrosarchaeum sp.]
MQLFNTLTRTKEEFKPLNEDEVRMYTCGPTVYNFAHIGNFRTYMLSDILRKSLEYCDFKVKQVMNITDIGHLASDADSGEDKMTKGLLREGKELNLENMRELAEFYTARFNEDLAKLNIKPPSGQYYASDYVKEDIELVQKLENKGFTYKTSDGIYFDTEKMPDYGILWGGKRTADKEHARIDENSEKRNSEDFALWKFNNQIGYPSPWGMGFPGWHIECSAMGMKFLGEQFDIHIGGIDHISIHHTNEIAQSECATGKKPFVRFWLHNEFVDTAGEKMAKSGDNFLTLNKVIEKGINPIAYRFWLLMAQYHTKMNFNWEALEASEVALKRLYRQYLDLGANVGQISPEYQNKFRERISDDLDTPRAISLLWDLMKDENVSNADKKATILDFDRVLSLGFADLKEDEVPEEIQNLVLEREEARKNKNFQRSDELRDKIYSLGYEVKDTDQGQKVYKY